MQDGYRAVLKGLEGEFGLAMGDIVPDEVDVNRGGGMGVNEGLRCEESSAAPTPPETEAPTTPKLSASRVHSRNPSITKKGSGGVGGNTGLPTTPFAVNEFTTVGKKAAPSSPSKKGKGRVRQVSKTTEDSMRVSVGPSLGDKRKAAEHEDEGKPKRRK